MKSVVFHIGFQRDRANPAFVTVTVRKSWWEAPTLANPRGVTRSKVVAQRRLKHPDAVDDVEVLIAELAQNLQPHPDPERTHASQDAPDDDPPAK